MTGEVDKGGLIPTTTEHDIQTFNPPAQGCHIWNMGLNGPMASEKMSFETVARQTMTDNCLSCKLPEPSALVS